MFTKAQAFELHYFIERYSRDNKKNLENGAKKYSEKIKIIK